MARSEFRSSVQRGRFAPGGYDTSGAADTTFGSVYEATRSASPKWDQISAKGMENASAEKRQAWASTADMYGTGMQAISNAKVGQMQAEATIQGSENYANAQTQSAGISGLSSLFSAGIGAIAMSDERTKHTINDIEQATSLLRDLRPVTFYYKEEYADEPKRKHYGFIAQEYERLMPDATYTLGDDGMKGINMQELIALLVSANQELESRIRRLEVKEALKPVVAGVR